MNGSKTAQRELPIVNMADVRRRERMRRKNFYLPKGMGKTTRLLSISEFCGAPVICASEDRRRHILSECKRWRYRVPAVYTAADLVSGRFIGTSRGDYVVDDADDVLEALLSRLSGGKIDVIASSSRLDEESDDFV